MRRSSRLEKDIEGFEKKKKVWSWKLSKLCNVILHVP